jgi:hypothetical protein
MDQKSFLPEAQLSFACLASSPSYTYTIAKKKLEETRDDGLEERRIHTTILTA